MAKRPNILKLATKISLESMTYTGITYNDPEYKILEPIIDDEMCAIMMHLRLEANRTVEDVANTLVFLSKDQGALTGQSLRLTHGWAMM